MSDVTIGTEVEALHEKIDLLSVAIGNLEERIKPILHEDAVPSGTSQENPESDVPLIASAEKLRHKVSLLVTRVQSIDARVAL